MVEVSLTVGKLDASLALLLTKDHHLIEFPTILLPDGISAGSIVKINCDRDIEQEIKDKEIFDCIQDEIYNTFGKSLPQAPLLKVRNVTQTSCVLEWEPLDIATASLKSLTLFKNGTRLGQIPNPLVNTTTKLSGLPVDTPYTFQLRMKTSAGEFNSKPVQIVTHKMTDLSGISVCLGEIDRYEDFTVEDIKECLANIAAKPLQKQVEVDTTHFVCTKASGPQWEKAVSMNIPVVRPEWLKACELERRIIGVRMFYLDADPAVLKQRNYWKKASSQPATPTDTAPPPLDKDVTEPKAEPTEEQEAEVAEPVEAQTTEAEATEATDETEAPTVPALNEPIDPKEFDDSPTATTLNSEEAAQAEPVEVTDEVVDDSEVDADAQAAEPEIVISAPEEAVREEPIEAETEVETEVEIAKPVSAVIAPAEEVEVEAEAETETNELAEVDAVETPETEVEASEEKEE
ncbi:unnamed protein product [Kuraishia capsulata CBS 1993]|uniref:Chitin biosynthesis protein CHS5 n=1 Tax=Kuraishia capsulata CBS 1993 TaxID=1382522 RepID=W6MP95_9ASCO|nr:uncharacterized protein KUCA_T00002899001 [Kuraishia capsulata CBS 1993]CDK26922.1 unnamed protein product [Kuraishia capsulata CBS 1993]